MEPNDSTNNNNPQIKKYLVGVFIIAAGFLLLLSNTGFLPREIKHIFFSWPMLLIGIGLISFVSSESRTPGMIMIAIGTIFLVPKVFDFPFSAWNLLWPMILIGIGVLILTKRVPRNGWRPRQLTPGKQTFEDGFIHEENIFSGGKQRVIHQVFRGGHINCVFGGSEVDLTQATLGEGQNELEINTIFGGVTLIVPADWRIQMKMTSIMGGFSDKRAYIRETADSTKVLVIKGSTIFGGGEIKSY